MHGGDIYRKKINMDYSVNINPYGIPKSVMEAMEEALNNVQRYPDIRCEELINMLTEKFSCENGQIVCLIKPQFEAGREQVGKKGVVRDKAVHLEVVERILAYASGIGFQILNLEFSPIKGPEGNIEYLLHLQNHPEGEDGPVIYEEMPVDPKKIVEEAHAALDKE